MDGFGSAMISPAGVGWPPLWVTAGAPEPMSTEAHGSEVQGPLLWLPTCSHMLGLDRGPKACSAPAAPQSPLPTGLQEGASHPPPVTPSCLHAGASLPRHYYHQPQSRPRARTRPGTKGSLRPWASWWILVAVYATDLQMSKLSLPEMASPTQTHSSFRGWGREPGPRPLPADVKGLRPLPPSPTSTAEQSP